MISITFLTNQDIRMLSGSFVRNSASIVIATCGVTSKSSVVYMNGVVELS